MCGIAGFVNREGVPADRDLLARMTATIAHRGPDGDGFYCDGPAGLGHRRLSIIDVAGGSQPLSNEDGSVWVTFNGEIYNDPELRAWLISKGHVFRTGTDTESLVHLYEEYGLDFARHLNGMFALAIWDAPRKRLVLARDRMGQKPLLFAETPSGGFVFGSEPKALHAHPEVPGGWIPKGWLVTCFTNTSPALIRSGMAFANSRRRISWSARRAARPSPDSGIRPSHPPTARASTRPRGDSGTISARRSAAIAGRTCRSECSSRAGSTHPASPPPWPSWSPLEGSGPSRSASTTRASTRAATPDSWPGTSGPTTASRPSRPRP